MSRFPQKRPVWSSRIEFVIALMASVWTIDSLEFFTKRMIRHGGGKIYILSLNHHYYFHLIEYSRYESEWRQKNLEFLQTSPLSTVATMATKIYSYWQWIVRQWLTELILSTLAIANGCYSLKPYSAIVVTVAIIATITSVATESNCYR